MQKAEDAAAGRDGPRRLSRSHLDARRGSVVEGASTQAIPPPVAEEAPKELKVQVPPGTKAGAVMEVPGANGEIIRMTVPEDYDAGGILNVKV